MDHVTLNIGVMAAENPAFDILLYFVFALICCVYLANYGRYSKVSRF